MVTFKPETGRGHARAAVCGLVAAFMATGLLLTMPASAQQQPAKPAPVGKAAKSEEGSAWVKLCDEQSAGGQSAQVCLTHHERFHPSTGQPLVSAAIRNIQGNDKEAIMVMVPLGRLLQPGLVLKVDEQKPVKLDYAYCTALGCVAEAVIGDDLIGKLKGGKELAIATIDVKQKRIGFLIPLNGFTKAYEGDPIDREVYAKARKQMFEQIRARQVELQKKAAEAAKNKDAGQGAGGAAKKQ